MIARDVEGYGHVTAKELAGGGLLKKGDFEWKGTP